jgi:hypothetical protein
MIELIAEIAETILEIAGTILGMLLDPIDL